MCRFHCCGCQFSKVRGITTSDGENNTVLLVITSGLSCEAKEKKKKSKVGKGTKCKSPKKNKSTKYTVQCVSTVFGQLEVLFSRLLCFTGMTFKYITLKERMMTEKYVSQAKRKKVQYAGSCVQKFVNVVDF